MGKSTILIVICMALGIAFLSVLGNWQVQRLAWKDNLITMTKARASAPAKTLREIESIWQNSGDVDYMSVKLEGHFDHARELYYYNTWNGRAGWNVITPFYLEDNRIILLNRGFVPLEHKNTPRPVGNNSKANIVITGLTRNPIDDKPNSLLPDNDLPKREFFWKSHAQMASLMGNSENLTVLPFMVDAGENTPRPGEPLGGTTRMDFPNNHLQYAVTWYGLAFSLLVVGSVFLYGRRENNA